MKQTYTSQQKKFKKFFKELEELQVKYGFRLVIGIEDLKVTKSK